MSFAGHTVENLKMPSDTYQDETVCSCRLGCLCAHCSLRIKSVQITATKLNATKLKPLRFKLGGGGMTKETRALPGIAVTLD